MGCRIWSGEEVVDARVLGHGHSPGVRRFAWGMAMVVMGRISGYVSFEWEDMWISTAVVVHVGSLETLGFHHRRAGAQGFIHSFIHSFIRSPYQHPKSLISSPEISATTTRNFRPRRHHDRQ